MQEKWQCKIAPSLGGGFAGTPNERWGTVDYVNQDDPTVFFGLYGLPDFYTLWRHKGRKAILWAGTDVIHFINGYWLDDKGETRLAPRPLAEWIRKNCDSYVENRAEYDALKKLGIEAKIIPSFLGNIDDYKINYKQNIVEEYKNFDREEDKEYSYYEKYSKPKVYTSVSSDNFVLYGWYDIENIHAPANPGIEFHLYGNTVDFPTDNANVIVHGRVSHEQMNEEVKDMQGALRLLTFDGFSEVLAKSILWGQWPVSAIKYPHMLSLEELGMLKDKKEPNIEGRNFYRNIINRYPWNQK